MPIDPIKFVDKKSYKKRVEDAKEKSGNSSSVVSGSAIIGGGSLSTFMIDVSLFLQLLD